MAGFTGSDYRVLVIFTSTEEAEGCQFSLLAAGADSSLNVSSQGNLYHKSDIVGLLKLHMPESIKATYAFFTAV